MDGSARLLVHAREARGDPALHLANDAVGALGAKGVRFLERQVRGNRVSSRILRTLMEIRDTLLNSIRAISSRVQASINMPEERRSEEGTRWGSQKSQCRFPRS